MQDSKQAQIDFLRAQLIAIKVGLEPGPAEMSREQIKELIEITLADSK